MNILYVDLDRGWRGGQSQALLTVQGLHALGEFAELVAIADSPLARRAADAGITVHGVAPRARRYSAARLLRRLLAGQRFDVVHVNEPHALTAAWLAGAHRRLPVVASRRVAYPLAGSALARARYRAVRRVLAISRFVANSVIASGYPAERVEIVTEGVRVPQRRALEARLAARQRWQVSEDDILLGCVGYLLPEKGQEFLIPALAALRKQFPACRLLLAGDGPSRRVIEELTHDLGQENAVILAGFVEEVEQVYQAIDLFVFPSLAEPLGTSLLAAMAHGIPVAAVARGGVPEIVEDGKTGVLASEAHADAIAATLASLLEDPEWAMQLGAAAREAVIERFSAERMARNTLAAYRRLLPAA